MYAWSLVLHKNLKKVLHDIIKIENSDECLQVVWQYIHNHLDIPFARPSFLLTPSCICVIGNSHQFINIALYVTVGLQLVNSLLWQAGIMDDDALTHLININSIKYNGIGKMYITVT